MNSVLLAARANPDRLRFPLLASPKIDGIRAIVLKGALFSRQFKLIPSEEAQYLFGHPAYEGFDGELIAASSDAPDVFHLTTSVVMSRSVKCGALRFMVFDDFTARGGFEQRLKTLRRRARKAKQVQLVEHTRIADRAALEAYEMQHVEQGYEGVMLRRPDGPYKQGRSTEREGTLLKLKRFQDAEAAVTGYVEEKLADGRKGNLGALLVRDRKTNMEFAIGSGFTEAERRELWAQRSTLKHQIVKYRFFRVGSRGRPRFPTFLGFRLDI